MRDSGRMLPAKATTGVGQGVAQSYWQRIGGMPLQQGSGTLPRSSRFVVIGGGFAGLATALRMKELDPAAEIVLLEAKSVGYGASGRNGGLVSPLAAPVWLAAAMQDQSIARAMRLLNRKADDAARWANATAPHAEVTPTTLLLEAQGAVTNAGISQVARILDRAEIEYRRFRPRDSKSIKPALAIDANTINPYALVRGLADAARQAGVEIVEGAPVKDIEQEQSGLRITLADGRAITAERAVLCTNAYTPSLSFGEVPRAKVVYNYMIATEQLSPSALERLATVSNGERPFVVELNTAYVFYRLHQGRLVFGGIEKSKQVAPGDLDVPVSILAGLDKLLGETLSGAPKPAVAEAWGGRFHMTTTDLPIIGPSASVPSLVLNIGYGGTGVALTLTLAPVAAALALGRQIEDAGLAEIHRAMRNTRLPLAGGVKFVAGVAGEYLRQLRERRNGHVSQGR